MKLIKSGKAMAEEEFWYSHSNDWVLDFLSEDGQALMMPSVRDNSSALSYIEKHKQELKENGVFFVGVRRDYREHYAYVADVYTGEIMDDPFHKNS